MLPYRATLNAGTGKSITIQYIVEALGLDPDREVCYACPTGKACNQLQKLGHRNVDTLHRVLWSHIPTEKGYFIKKPKPREEVECYKLIVVDEVSMVPQEMIEQLFNYDVFVIFCGDPGQLEPVSGETNEFLKHPDIFFDEVMRQAKESDIIRLSLDIREGKPLEIYKGTDAMVLSPKDLTDGMMHWADEILVATNAKRIGVNNYMRRLYGHDTEGPQPGDKIIARHNYHEIYGNKGFNLMNGTIGVVGDGVKEFQRPRYVKYPLIKEAPFYKVKFTTDYGQSFGTLNIDKQKLLTGTYSLTFQEQQLKKKAIKEYLTIPWQRREAIEEGIPLEFEYAFAITCHSAQGSSWDKILLLEEKFPHDKKEHIRWLYTGLTRCQEKAIIIKGE